MLFLQQREQWLLFVLLGPQEFPLKNHPLRHEYQQLTN